MAHKRWISSWRQRKVSARTEGAAIAGATVLVVWTHVWGRCTSWFLRQSGYIPFFVTERKRSEAALIQVVQKSFPGASWQRCKVHFMRNILAYVPQKEKKSFAAVLKEIWLAPTAELARRRAYDVMDAYAKRFPKVVQCLENGLEDSLTRHPMSAW